MSQTHSFGDTSSGFCRLNGRLIFRSATNEKLHMSTLSGSGGGRNKQNVRKCIILQCSCTEVMRSLLWSMPPRQSEVHPRFSNATSGKFRCPWNCRIQWWRLMRSMMKLLLWWRPKPFCRWKHKALVLTQVSRPKSLPVIAYKACAVPYIIKHCVMTENLWERWWTLRTE